MDVADCILADSDVLSKGFVANHTSNGVASVDDGVASVSGVWKSTKAQEGLLWSRHQSQKGVTVHVLVYLSNLLFEFLKLVFSLDVIDIFWLLGNRNFIWADLHTSKAKVGTCLSIGGNDH